jgi:hypothetical protein
MATLSVKTVLGAFAILVVVAVVGGAVVLGMGMFGLGDGGGGSESGPTTPVPTGTVYPVDGDGEGTTDDQPPFTFEIDSIEQCGQTCRDVTATVYNDQNRTASNVTVYSRIYAGNSTNQSDRIWSGQEQIGTLEAGGSATRTQRVELSASEGFAVQQNDGWVTIRTTVRSERTTVTFVNRRNVT